MATHKLWYLYVGWCDKNIKVVKNVMKSKNN